MGRGRPRAVLPSRIATLARAPTSRPHQLPPPPPLTPLTPLTAQPSPHGPVYCAARRRVFDDPGGGDDAEGGGVASSAASQQLARRVFMVLLRL